MKQLRLPLLLLAGMLTFFGCTQTLYTHQQVLQKCQNKNDVLQQFGQPDEVNPGPGFDQWTYNMANRTEWKNPKKEPVALAVTDSLVKDSVQVANPVKYDKYVKFMFDKDGKIMGYKAEGIDLTHKEKDSFGKSLGNITAGVLVISVLVALELYKNSSNNQ